MAALQVCDHPPVTSPAWIEIDVEALAHNARVLRRATPPGTRLGLMVKANGYGHGMELAARAALDGGAELLMVATLDEGLALRAAGVAGPLLVVYPIPLEGVRDAVQADLQLSVAGRDGARRLLDRASGHDLTVHVELDSGMGRGGVAAADLADVVGAIDATPGVTLGSVWSHLADGSDPEVSREQIGRYDAALESLVVGGRAMPVRHVTATEGLFRATAPAYDMVRIGLGFYGELGVGVEAAPETATLAADLRGAMTVKVRPIRLEDVPAGSTIGYGGEWTTERPSRIATLPIGYADGWTRAYWPGASALVRGRRVPLVGRVSMDSVCADVTDVPGVGYDDEIVLLGGQGEERITASDLARLRGSIPNEVFCAFGPRLPRVARQGSGSA